MSEIAMNDQGGVFHSPAEMRRAKAVDLGTLPTSIPGTNCGNCRFFKTGGSASGVSVGLCAHPAVKMIVSERECCGKWDNKGYLRQWE